MSESGGNALILGVGGGIGRAYFDHLRRVRPGWRVHALGRDPEGLPPARHGELRGILDLTAPESIDLALEGLPRDLALDHALLATGWLHDPTHRPEKRYRELEAEHLVTAYRLNAVGPALFLARLLDRIDRKHPTRIGVLSARLGSITDNRSGGWHSYRASKAALNMLLKNFAIELTMNRSAVIVAGLQPGTTDTALSRPFQARLPAGQLQTPAFTAERLFAVIDGLGAGDSGGRFDFEGNAFPP